MFELCACIRFFFFNAKGIKCIRFQKMIKSLVAFKDLNRPHTTIMEHYQNGGCGGGEKSRHLIKLQFNKLVV